MNGKLTKKKQITELKTHIEVFLKLFSLEIRNKTINGKDRITIVLVEIARPRISPDKRIFSRPGYSASEIRAAE